MIIRHYHRLRHICSATLPVAVRCLIYMLLLLPAMVQAQEEADSLVAKETASQVEKGNEANNLIRKINFTPEQAQHQNRFNPREKDSLFTKVWWKRLYGGVGFGMMGMTDNIDRVSNIAHEAYLGYRFSPVNSLRVHFNYAPYRYSTGYNAATALGVGVVGKVGRPVQIQDLLKE